MNDILIRRAVERDISSIVRFNANMAAETEGLSLDKAILSAGVEAVFNDPKKGFYLIADVDGQARACLMVTVEWSDWRNGLFWWIQSVFVETEFRRMGLFSKMYANLKDSVDNDEYIAGLRLYVEENNHAAQKTYLKQGMYKTHYYLFEEL